MSRDPYLPPTPRWRLRPPAPPEAVEALCRELKVPPLLAEVLWSRGLREDADAHLNPPLAPSRVANLDAAAERLEDAIRGRRRILVHGDYDADGISGTAILTLGLRELGADVTPFIPDRLTDGYGVHPDRVAQHADAADLFLTVDCGISNLEEIRRLQAAGVEVIVSDHHTPGEALPPCLVVHPRIDAPSGRAVSELTGAGVAFHLLWALRRRLGMDPPLEYTDLATLGTIADVAPLLGENRALIKEGLTRLANSRWPGVRASVVQAHLTGGVTARQVAFALAPRLNAAGRLGEAGLGLELLTTASERRARELAAYLDARNQDRRRIQDEMFAQALEHVDPEAPALVVEDPRWHPGVMGIVASKLLERFYKPVFIVAQGKGSVRSTPGISAVEGLRAASAHLLRYGGHAQAAGFSLDMQDLPAFRDTIERYAATFPTPVPEILADALIDGREVDDGLWRAIQALEPFGQGHPAPLFALGDRLDAIRAVGRERATLQLRVGGVKGVGWRMGALADDFRVGEAVDVAVTLNENEWQQRRTLEFVAEAVRTARTVPLALDEGPEAHRWLGRIARGPAPAGTPVGAADEEALRAALGAGGALWLRTLPESDALPVLRLAVAGAGRVHFDLSNEGLEALERQALAYPSLHDIRRGFVALQRGLPLPFDTAKNTRVRAALEELALVDGTGRARRGQRRDPFTSPSLLHGMLQRHLLRRFRHAYRRLDDVGFALTVGTLFGGGDGEDGAAPGHKPAAARAPAPERAATPSAAAEGTPPARALERRG